MPNVSVSPIVRISFNSQRFCTHITSSINYNYVFTYMYNKTSCMNTYKAYVMKLYSNYDEYYCFFLLYIFFCFFYIR